VLFGFERERTKRLIDMFEYDVVSLAYGSKNASIKPVHYDLNHERYQEMFDWYPNANRLEISLIDPYTTKDQIIKYLEDFSDCNVVIAPMNTKISTIGVGLVTIERPEIQLYYLSANLYNYEGYSKPGDDCYLFELKSSSIKIDTCRYNENAKK